jgi:hypothetical protein
VRRGSWPRLSPGAISDLGVIVMKANDAIRLGIEMSSMVCGPYVADLSDEDLMRRPHPSCNHLKWQLGHLIAAEHSMINTVCPGSMPPLPPGFVDRYTKETARSDDPARFDSKDTLLRVHGEQRGAMLAALNRLSDMDLDQPSPEAYRSYAPTVGALFSMQGSHWLMHAGQWVIVRRELGREPLF